MKYSNDMYIYWNNLHLHVIAKMFTGNKTNIDANTAAIINVTLNLIFAKLP